MKILYILLISLSKLTKAEALPDTAYYRLNEKLFKDYNPSIRPLLEENQNTAISIQIDFVLYNILLVVSVFVNNYLNIHRKY